MAKLLIYTDGASLNNPGPSAWAYVILHEEGDLLHHDSHVIGTATNNQTEYQAVIEALKFIRKNLSLFLKKNVETLTVRSDSQLIIHQLTGRYKVADIHLYQLHHQVEKLKKELENSFPITFEHIPREENRLADGLTRRALKEYREEKATLLS